MDCIVHGGHKELDMMVHIACLRGATPRPRSGAEAGRTPCLRGGSQEELPHVRDQGQRPRVPACDSTGAATPHPRSGVAAENSYLSKGGFRRNPQAVEELSVILISRRINT